MIQPPENNIVLTVATKYLKAISNILKVAAIENLSKVDPVDLVQIVGDVVAVPKRIRTADRSYEGFTAENIRVGDVAIMRYDVIYSFYKKNNNGDADFRNSLFYNGKEYWFADIQKIFGVIRDNEIIMLNGYVMVEDFHDPVIILPTSSRESVHLRETKILHIGDSLTTEKPLEAEAGDRVLINEKMSSKYQIGEKKFRIVKQKYIYGVKS